MYQDLDFTDNNYYQEDYIDSPVDDFDWMPNLFAKLANHLRTSTSADVIRLGTIGCIRNNEPGDDSLLQWEEVETMRRYIDSVNRGHTIGTEVNILYTSFIWSQLSGII